MIHVVTKWKCTFLTETGIEMGICYVDNDFYANVLEIMSKISFGIAVSRIIIEKINRETQTGVTRQ